MPSSTVQRVARSIIEDGKVEHAWLGVSGVEFTSEIADALNIPTKAGVLVGEVVKGSPADKAGIEGGSANMVIEGTGIRPGGDVILEFDGEKLTTMRQLAGLVDGKQPGDGVEVVFIHDGDRKTATLKLGDRPLTAAESGDQ